MYVIESDLTQILPTIDIEDIKLSSAPTKLQLLSTFSDADEVSFTENDGYYIITDNHSELKLRVPSSDALTNKYTEDNLPELTNDSLMFEYNIPSAMSKKIKKTTNQTMSQNIDLLFTVCEDAANVKASIMSSDKNIILQLFEAPCEKQLLTETIKTKLNWDCLVLSCEEMLLSFYRESGSVGIAKLNVKLKEGVIDFYQRLRMRG